MGAEFENFASAYEIAVGKYEARRELIGRIVSFETGENKFAKGRIKGLNKARTDLKNLSSK